MDARSIGARAQYTRWPEEAAIAVSKIQGLQPKGRTLSH